MSATVANMWLVRRYQMQRGNIFVPMFNFIHAAPNCNSYLRATSCRAGLDLPLYKFIEAELFLHEHENELFLFQTKARIPHVHNEEETLEVAWTLMSKSFTLSALITKTVNNRASGRKGYEHWRCCANGRSVTVQTAASAILSQSAIIPQGKVTVTYF